MAVFWSIFCIVFVSQNQKWNFDGGKVEGFAALLCSGPSSSFGLQVTMQNTDENTAVYEAL